VSRGTVLHVSPHPDDELIGAPATLMALRDAGFEVLNLALGLGSEPRERGRRAAELAEASRRAGFGLLVAEPPVALSAAGASPGAEEAAREHVAGALEQHAPALVVSPWAHDRHPSHELVGRAVRDALAASADPPPWWTWGLWAALAEPTLFVPFDDDRLAEIDSCLAAYAGEIERNDYRRLVAARASANAILGTETVFGFGSRARPGPYAELLSELVHRAGRWLAGARRMLDPDDPFAAG
jgi:LmbE family N-acetylglucosaminyl deacetylase